MLIYATTITSDTVDQNDSLGKIYQPWPEIRLVKNGWRDVGEALEDHVDGLAEAALAGRVDRRQLREVGVKLGNVVLGGQGGLERRLQLPVDDVRPADVLEVSVLLDRLGVGRSAAQALRRLQEQDGDVKVT